MESSEQTSSPRHLTGDEIIINRFLARDDSHKITVWKSRYLQVSESKDPKNVASGLSTVSILGMQFAFYAIVVCAFLRFVLQIDCMTALYISLAGLVFFIVLNFIAGKQKEAAGNYWTPSKVAEEVSKELGYSLSDEQLEEYSKYSAANERIRKQRESTSYTSRPAPTQITPSKPTVPPATTEQATVVGQAPQQPIIVVANGMPPCPRCGSRDVYFIDSTKKAVSLGKAAVGAAMFGVPGAVVGGVMGKKGKKVYCCNSCNRSFSFKNLG